MKNIKEKVLKEVEERFQKEALNDEPPHLFCMKEAIDLTLIEVKKNDASFIEHIQNHLDKGERGLKLYKLPEGKVGCAICGKTVEEIIR